GTWIREAQSMERPLVTAVTHSEDMVLFVLRDVSDRPGSAAALFEAVAREHVNVDTILQNAAFGHADVSFSVPSDDVAAARRAVDAARETVGAVSVEEITDVGTVSLVGAGMRSHPGVAAQMFRALADEAINLRLISTSPIKITVMIDRAEVERAVRTLHSTFGLGEERADESAN